MADVPEINPSLTQAQARPRLAASDYVHGVLAADHVLLARAITLLESTRLADKALAREVLTQCQPHAGGALRIAVTGAPGVGKSSLIETLGCRLVALGRRVAVLATDPTSVLTGGSILGDKTRMPMLAASDQTFIRPSPSAGTLGGVTQAARQTILLVEAAGYEIVLVETVGVGQSEVAVRSIVDVVLLLVLAQAGDELQAVKRGIVEAADIIAVAKTDGPAMAEAQEAQRQYKRSLKLFPAGPSGIRPSVLSCSAVTGDGIDGLWEAVVAHAEATKRSGYFERNRAVQARLDVKRAAEEALRADFLAHPEVSARLRALQEEVATGEQTAWAATDELLRLYRSS